MDVIIFCASVLFSLWLASQAAEWLEIRHAGKATLLAFVMSLIGPPMAAMVLRYYLDENVDGNLMQATEALVVPVLAIVGGKASFALCTALAWWGAENALGKSYRAGRAF